MLRKNAVRSKARSLASKAGWMGWIVAILTISLTALFHLPFWVACLFVLAFSIAWGHIEHKLVNKFVDEIFAADNE